MRLKSAIAVLLFAFAVAFFIAVAVVPKPATAELWPHCNCMYYCATNPPADPKHPTWPIINTIGEIEFPGGGPCLENPTCQECPPEP